MALYRATIRVQDGMKRWIDAASHSDAQELAETYVQVLNSSPCEYRRYEVRNVVDRQTVVAQVREVDQGLTNESVENLLEYVDQAAS